MRFLLIITYLFALQYSILAQDLDKILEAHYDAAAKDRMEKVEAIVTKGKNVYTMAGIETSFTTYQCRPNKIRVEGEFQGSKVIQTFNGEQGWMYAPAMGIPEPKELKDAELKSIVNQSDFEKPLWNYQEKGYSLELAGSSEDGSAYHLVLDTDDNKLNFFIDKESHLISTIKSVQIMGGSETEIEIIMLEYKNVKGIPMAQNVVTKMNGEVVTTIEIEKVEYHKNLDSVLFEKPAID